MRLNARIRSLLERFNYWHCIEAFEEQNSAVDNIILIKTGRIDRPGTFRVSYRCYDPKHEGEPLSQQYWYSDFTIRDSLGNPTNIGRLMGIKCRDKMIPIYTPKGHAIDRFLHRVARIHACRLTRDRSQIQDQTV